MLPRTVRVDHPVNVCYESLRFNVVFVPVALWRDLDGVALGDDVDVALEVALLAAGDVVGVSQQCPFVVELMV